MKKTLRNFAALATLFAMFLPFTKVFAAQTVEAYGANTIAGYETLLTSTQVSPWQDVIFSVTKPDGSVLNLKVNSGADGVAKATLADYHTRKAGQYSVTASSGSQSGAVHTFQVFPDKVSAQQSAVVLDRTVVQPGNQDVAHLNVQLLDNYGNAVQNHLVQVYSSRTQDVVKNLTVHGVSDAQGKISFAVSSGQPGVSEYTVLDSTAGAMLTQKVRVAYVKGSDLMANVMMADVGGDAGPMNNFDISGLPVKIQPNQNVNFTVTARDAVNQTVQNYMGKVHFSADGANGANASLPEDYTFTADDLGVHQFSLGLSFKSAGTYTIVVTDLANNLIKGTKDVVVGDGGAPQQNGDGSITLDTPMAGTYSQKIQTLSGKAQSGNTVRLYDNQQEIGSVQATNEGKYTFQTSPLSDGQHSVYAMMYDAGQVAKGTSNTVLFTIQTTAPTVDDVILDPDHGIQPGSTVNVKVMSAENLPQVAVVLDGNIIQLKPGLETAGLYVGTLQAPAAPGLYPVDVLVVDQLGNEGSYKAKAQLTVTNEVPTVTPAPATGTDVVPPATTNTAPAKIRGLVAYPRPGKVVLVWDAGSDAETVVKHYRVYFGADPQKLDRYMDTFDASTTWYVPNLEAGKEYYFAVTAIDSEGLESVDVSDLVSSTITISQVAAGGGGAGLHGSAEEMAASLPYHHPGPELLWLLFGSGAVGSVVKRLRRKVR